MTKPPPKRQLKKLGDKDIFTLIMGQSPDSKTYNKNGLGLPFFQGKKEFGKTSPIVEQRCNEPIRIAETGDILLSVRAPVGPTNIANQKCCIGRGLAGIRVNKEMGSNSYIGYFFKKFQVEISNLGKGSTFDAITKADLEKVHIPLPPLPTQHAIVAKLDEVQEQISEAKQSVQAQLDALDTLWQSSLSEVFENINGNKIKLGNKDVFILIMGQSPDSKNYNKEGMGLPFFQGKKEFGKISPIVEQRCTDPIRIAETGDILLSVRAPVGPTNIADQKCCIGRGLGAIRVNKKIGSNAYIGYFFKKFQVEISNLGKGSTFDAITKKDLENIEIVMPSLTEQQSIVAHLDTLSSHIATLRTDYKQQLQQYDELRASTLDKALKGELVE